MFIIFAALNFLWVPIVYFFFPETQNIELEDINLLFARGGFTGGVFSTGGRTVRPHQHAEEANLEAKREVSMIENAG